MISNHKSGNIRKYQKISEMTNITNGAHITLSLGTGWSLWNEWLREKKRAGGGNDFGLWTFEEGG